MNTNERLHYRDMELQGKNTNDYLEYHRPKTLFKYRSGIFNAEAGVCFDVDALENQYIWEPNVMDLNDPYDCAIRFELSRENILSAALEIGVEKEVSKLTEKDRNQLLCGLQDVINKQMKEFKKGWHVISFSERVDSILMWSYYSNNHKGFCIEYPTDGFKSCVLPIIYSDEFTNVCENIEGVKLSVLTKALEWQHEKEWRIVNRTIDENMMGGFKYPAPKPVAIYLGCRIDDNMKLKEQILRYATSEKISVYQMHMQMDSYLLKPYKIL